MSRREMPGVPQILTVRKTVDTLEENAGNFFFAARLITVTSRRRFRNLMSPAGNDSQSSLASCFPSFRTLRLYHKSPHVSRRGRRARFFWRRVARARTVAASNSRGEYSVERCSPVRQEVRLPDLRGHQDGFRGEKLRGR